VLQRLAGVIACALALTLGAATTAQAATLTLIDGPGDVWEDAGPTDPLSFKPHKVPEREQGDILRTTITHAQRQLEIRTRFAELARKGRSIQLSAKLRTDTGAIRYLRVWTGVVRDWRLMTTVVNGRGRILDPVDPQAPPGNCTISPTIDYATNVAVIRLPRTCLNDPRTVQVSFSVHTGSTLNPFIDNPINHQLDTRALDGMPRFSAPIPVG
jgi:hypothetical protein